MTLAPGTSQGLSPDIALDPFHHLAELVALHARERPAAIAVIAVEAAVATAPGSGSGQERCVNYAEFDALADRVAAALQRDGARPQQTVALCAAGSLASLAVFIGTLRAGLAAVPLPASATSVQLADMLADVEPRALFVDRDGAAALGPAPDAAPGPHVRVHLEAGIAGGGTNLEDWLGPPGSRPSPVTIEPGWPFDIIYSSGTTGTPKGIVQPHAMRWAHIRRAAASGMGPGSVSMIATPIYSNTTLVTVVQTLAWGGAVLPMRKFDVATYLVLAERHRATHTMLVPVQYRRLMQHPDFDRYDLSPFLNKYCTSAPFDAALKAEVLRRWPGGLTEYYGMTEGGASAILPAHLHPDKLHTVGRPGVGCEIRLLDEAGRALAPEAVARGESGEIVGRSPGMMSGYHKRPQATAEAEWFDEQGRRYIRTGDVGRFDADGFLVLGDRKKDMVISGGFNIYPSDLEAVLRRHEAVAEASVFGVPSERWGEAPVAAVVLRAGHAIGAAALREWVNAQVGKMQRLADLRLVGELPRSAIGKVLKRELRERWHAAAPQQAG